MASPESGAERRARDRVDLNQRIQIKFDKFQDFLTEIAGNISPGGMFVRSADPHEPGERFDFECVLADGFPLVSGRAEVVWVRSASGSGDSPSGMGVRFVELRDKSEMLIRKIVEQRLADGAKTFDLEKERGPGAPEAPTEAPFETPSAPPPTPVDPAAAAAAPDARESALTGAALGAKLEEQLPTPPSTPGLPKQPSRDSAPPDAPSKREVTTTRPPAAPRSERKSPGPPADRPAASATLAGTAVPEAKSPAPGKVSAASPKTGAAGAGAPAAASPGPGTSSAGKARKSVAVPVKVALPPQPAPEAARPAWQPAQPAAVPSAARGREMRAAGRSGGRRKLGLGRLFELVVFSLIAGGAVVLLFNQFWVIPRIESLEARLEELTGDSRVGAAAGIVRAEERANRPTEPPEASAERATAVAESRQGPAETDAEAVPRPTVEETVQSWARAWSERRVEDYLACYAADFVPASGALRSEWERRRRQRLQSQGAIRVAVVSMTTEEISPTETLVTFTQSYRSDTYRDRVRKTLRLRWSGERWQIAEEIVTRQLPW